MIFMTSNLGGVEITELMTGGMGFAPVQRADTVVRLDEKVEKTAAEAAKRKFAPEFMNRIDKTVVFHPLRSEQLEQILEIELGMVQQRVLETAKGRFLFRVTQPARDFLLREGTDLKYGARHLKRAIERHVVYPLASLLATEQVSLGRRDFDRLAQRRTGLDVLEGSRRRAGADGFTGNRTTGGCRGGEFGRPDGFVSGGDGCGGPDFGEDCGATDGGTWFAGGKGQER